MKRVYSRVAVEPARPPRLPRLRSFGGALLTPFYLGVAWLRGTPGVELHARTAAAAAGWWWQRRIGRWDAYALALHPFDSVRYFELSFAVRAALRRPAAFRYLDVSSPRLLPLHILLQSPSAEAVLVNPDANDLAETQRLFANAGVDRRCTWSSATIDAAELEVRFDLVTCISVVEHIPHDHDAVRRLFDALRPGGRLVLSVPCAAVAFEEMIDWNEYGLLRPDENGFVFGQRFYDEKLLAERILSVTGAPVRREIWGERRPGLFVADRRAKLRGDHPFWREPLTFAQTYRRFDSIGELPGIGVVAMEFEKR